MTALLKFPRQPVKAEKERPMFSEKFENGYLMSSQLYRKEVYPFLSDAARHVYFELENRINGYKKESDFVSYSQLQGSAELKNARIAGRAAVAKGLKELISLGVIEVLASGKQGMKSYQINEISLVNRFTNETSSHTEPVHNVNQTSSHTEPKLVHNVNTHKITKDNNKDNTHKRAQENSVDAVLNLWTPDLHSLNSWLQRSGEMPMTQDEVNLLLPEVNAHYERHIKSGAATDTKMYSNFVKWVKGDFSKYKKQNQSHDKQSTSVKPKQQREQAWADYYAKRNQQQPSMIDVIEVQHD